jgi:hypothetical protein
MLGLYRIAIYLTLMSTEAPIIIKESNLSLAWAGAFLAVARPARRGLNPLVITVGDFASPLPSENAGLRLALDKRLIALDKNPTDVSAMTIFPYKMWIRLGQPNCAEFSARCIQRLLPRLKKLDRRNQNGTYFERMMAYTGVRRDGARTVNQLQFIIDLLARDRRPRESALQIACFDPAKDHTGQPVRGFPCLQQVSVSYDNDDNLAISAFYPTQYIFDRAYGNYLGLCHLGHFLANETGLKFSRLTCFIGKPELGDVNKCELISLTQMASSLLGSLPAPALQLGADK